LIIMSKFCLSLRGYIQFPNNWLCLDRIVAIG
jgi:hypothetical protein